MSKESTYIVRLSKRDWVLIRRCLSKEIVCLLGQRQTNQNLLKSLQSARDSFERTEEMITEINRFNMHLRN